jgi:cyclohexa-1,5-dienecarbonyl-CoA hydratase
MTVRMEVDEGIATLTLDHPPLNVLTRAVLRELREASLGLRDETGIRAVVLAATGKHFSAGADVGEHLPPAFRDLIPEMVGTVEAVASLPVPVIAAVRGRCLGGGFELVQAADIIVAGEGASFGQPEILLGVTAPIACALLPRRGPYGHAAEILFTGDPIGATRAAASGFVQRLVPDDQVEPEARAIAARCARHSAAALHATKRTLRAAVGRTRPEALQAAAAIYLEEVMDTRDALEGLRAFTEKRTPVWEHR